MLESADAAPGPAPSRSRWRRVGLALVKLVPFAGLAVAVITWTHLPHMRLEPAMVGLGCWTIGNYLFCPLRWKTVSSRGQRWRWYARVYAEGELLGMLTPQHAGADLWRMRQLCHQGSDKKSAFVEIAADRLSGGVIVTVLAVLAGATIPPQLLPVAGGAVAVIALAVWATRRWWRPRVPEIERPKGWSFVRAALVSALYQAGYLGFILGLLAAVGHHVDLMGTASVLGLSQAAGLLPGIHGAGPKEGAMAGGFVALGVPLSAALAAVALGAALTWLPAIAIGGSGLAVRGWHGRRGRSRGAAVA